jgi:hypothetical protein
MKQQVTRLEPHQNGKVMGVLMAVGSCVFALPMLAVLLAVSPLPAGSQAPPALALLLVPLAYGVLGYLSVALGCLLYNATVRFTGGFAFEARSVADR